MKFKALRKALARKIHPEPEITNYDLHSRAPLSRQAEAIAKEHYSMRGYAGLAVEYSEPYEANGSTLMWVTVTNPAGFSLRWNYNITKHVWLAYHDQVETRGNRETVKTVES